MVNVKIALRCLKSRSFWHGFEAAFKLRPPREHRRIAGEIAQDLNRSIELDTSHHIYEVWAEVGKQIEGAANEYGKEPNAGNPTIDRAARVEEQLTLTY